MCVLLLNTSLILILYTVVLLILYAVIFLFLNNAKEALVLWWCVGDVGMSYFGS